ncbi:hypothetical protein NPIL_207821, partial [Nephila pilipes]
SPVTLREGVMQQVSPQNCMVEELPKETVNQFQCAAGTNQSICVVFKVIYLYSDISHTKRKELLSDVFRGKITNPCG